MPLTEVSKPSATRISGTRTPWCSECNTGGIPARRTSLDNQSVIHRKTVARILTGPPAQLFNPAIDETIAWLPPFCGVIWPSRTIIRFDSRSPVKRAGHADYPLPT